MQAAFSDILDSNWTADEPKRRIGGIRRAKVLDLDNDDSEEDEQPVYCAQPFNQPDIEALAEDPTLAASTLDADPIYPLKARLAAGVVTSGLTPVGSLSASRGFSAGSPSGDYGAEEMPLVPGTAKQQTGLQARRADVCRYQTQSPHT